MIPVSTDHFLKLHRDDWPQLFRVAFRHLSPIGKLFLHQDAMAVTPVKYSIILLPVKTGKDAVALPEKAEHLFLICSAFCRSAAGIGAGHPFHAGQTYRFPIQQPFFSPEL